MTERKTRVRMVPGGPLLVEGPVEVDTPEGEKVTSDRFLVALCACRRSKRYPFCDTSHRRRSARPETSGQEGSRQGVERPEQ